MTSQLIKKFLLTSTNLMLAKRSKTVGVFLQIFSGTYMENEQFKNESIQIQIMLQILTSTSFT